jgi:hypothetical protein
VTSLEWVLLGLGAAAVITYVAWWYGTREEPVKGRAFAAVLRAAVLLLVVPAAGGIGNHTGKLFNYLASGRPILALAPAGNVAAELIRESRSGVAVPPDDVDAVVGRPGDRMEPLPGLYRGTCLQAVERELVRGERSLSELLASLRVHALSAEALRSRDPDLRSYVNINGPGDLAQARAMAGHAATVHSQPAQLVTQRR